MFRRFLPAYRKTIKRFSKGRGIGKKQPVKLGLKLLERLFRSDIIEIQGNQMYLPKKGFDEYSTLGVYGELDTETVKHEIHEGDIAVDVGAAIGYYTLIFAKIVQNTGKVFAFEPKQDRFELLQKNVELNEFSNITLEQKAILDKNEETKGYYSKNKIGGLKIAVSDSKQFSESEKIDAVRLDDYFKEKNLIEKIKFIKIDVDGPELDVLQSANTILRNKNLKILIEWDPERSRKIGRSPDKIIDLLLENNFKIFYPDFKKGVFVPINKKTLLESNNENQTINLFCKKE